MEIFPRLRPWLLGAALILMAPHGMAQDVDPALEELPDSFFQVSPSRDKLSIRRPADVLPVFPRLGDPQAPVKIDYFYSHDCLPCARATTALYKSLTGGAEIEVVFHPLAVDQDSFDAAVAETILYASQPELFDLFHLGSMEGEQKDEAFDRQQLLIELIGAARDPAGLAGRFEYYTDWIDALAVNAEILTSLGTDKLPAFVINDNLYTGFVSEESLTAAIDAAKAPEP